MSWKNVKLGKVITQRKEFITIDDSVEYKRCRVQVNRKGIVLRDVVKGIEINTKKQQLCKEGDFLVAEIDAKVGGYGFVGKDLEGAIVSSHYFLFEVDENKLLRSYFAWLIKTDIIQDQIASKGSTNYAAIRPQHVLDFEIPLPSVEEQEEIVNRLNAFNAEYFLLDKELNQQQTYLQLLRQTILQEAVQGKLTKQDPTDEPATALLQRIKAEKERLIKEGKLKKEKELPPITENEIPFDLPEGWVWCRLGELIKLMDAGWSPACIETPASTDKWGVLKTTSVQQMEYLENENKQLPEKLSPKEHYEVKVGDILFTRAGPFNRVGICCLVENTRDKLMISDKIIRFHLYEKHISSKHITLCLNTGASKAYLESKKSGMALSQVNISQDNLKLTPIPLPPNAEQHRIVAKVQQLQQHLNQLEAQVQQSRQYAQGLLQSVLQEAFNKGKVYAMNESAISMVAEE